MRPGAARAAARPRGSRPPDLPRSIRRCSPRPAPARTRWAHARRPLSRLRPPAALRFPAPSQPPASRIPHPATVHRSYFQVKSFDTKVFPPSEGSAPRGNGGSAAAAATRARQKRGPLGNRVRDLRQVRPSRWPDALGLGAVSSVTTEQGQPIPEKSALPEPAPSPPAASWAGWLVVGLYLLASFALTWRLWADPAGRAAGHNPGDVNLVAWFMRYSATAVSHGRLPALVTTGLNAPQGINMMWNASMLLPGVILAPVTLLAGPFTSLNLLLAVGFAGSAASLFWVLRWWGASITAAAVGGAVYGFSPALVAASMGHFQLQFAVLPPLIIHAVLRIVTGRGAALRAGVRLGLLTAAQLFIGEEGLVDTPVAAVVVVAVLALGHARATLEAIHTRARA